MKEVFLFLSKDGKTHIHAVRWIPEDGRYSAILQITHGMVEFIERYEPLALFLNRKGFMVVGHDHLGHGESVNTADDWGYFAPENAAEILIEDMHTLRTVTQAENPGLPYFILGHSMGALLLQKYIALHAGPEEGIGKLSGAIIMGTGFTNPRTSAFGIKVTDTLAKVLGWRHCSTLVTFLAFNKCLRYDTNGKDPQRNWLSRDPESVRRYYSDPRCTFRFTLNGYKALFETVFFVCRQENVAPVPKDLPVLFVSGGDDPVGNCGRGVRRTAAMFRRAGIRDLKLKIYEGCRHEILNDTGREQVFRDLLRWMKKRSGGSLRKG